jgi:tyrosine-protein kinase Etk/Wzc
MEEKNLADVLSALYKKRKTVLSFTISTMVLVALVSLFLPDYYRASTVFYAMSPDVAKPEYIFGQSSAAMNYYGSEEDVDRIFSIAKSRELVFFIVDSFDLYKLYNIDPQHPKAKAKIVKKFKTHYRVLKTEYGGIELGIEDKDPELSSLMTKAARNYINEKSTQLIKNIQISTLNVLSSDMLEKQQRLTQMADSLISIRKEFGIYNTETQSEALAGQLSTLQSALIRDKARLEVLKSSPGIKKDTLAFIKAKVQGHEAELNALLGNDQSASFNIDKFNRGQGVFDILSDQLEKATTEVSYQKQRFNRIQSALQSHFDGILTIEDAEIPQTKERPVRSLWVMVSGILMFVLMLLYVMLTEFYGNIKIKTD